MPDNQEIEAAVAALHRAQAEQESAAFQPDLRRGEASHAAVRRAMADTAAAGGADPGGAVLPPLTAIRAASVIESDIRAERDLSILSARQAGHSWEEIASALFHFGPGAAGYAYRSLTAEPERVIGWICPACDQYVRDSGPGAPADAEQGHAQGCQRLADTTAAWEAAR